MYKSFHALILKFALPMCRFERPCGAEFSTIAGHVKIDSHVHCTFDVIDYIAELQNCRDPDNSVCCMIFPASQLTISSRAYIMQFASWIMAASVRVACVDYNLSCMH